MENIFINPAKEDWSTILKRPVIDNKSLEATVSNVLKEVQLNGDTAVKKYTAQFDGIEITELKVSEAEINEAITLVDETLKAAIQTAKNNITLFHENQREVVRQVQTTKNVLCWRKS